MSYSRKKQNQQNVGETIILGILKAIGMLFRAIFKGSDKKGLSSVERQEIATKRYEIQEMIKSQNVHELRQAVFEADKLVDRILMVYGYNGQTMGERLKSARDFIDRNIYDGIWQEHIMCI
jgi:hypothetical protein